MAEQLRKIKLILLFGSILTVAQSLEQIAKNSDLRKFCLIFALPGRSNGPNIDKFKSMFNVHLDKVGKEIFGSSDHLTRMQETQGCSFKNSSTLKCAYHRISKIGNYLIEDMKSLEKHLDPRLNKTGMMYGFLLSSWYMDRVFLNLKCTVVDPNEPRPTFQWKRIAKWSKILLSRQDFCSWSKPFQRTVAINLRREVMNICNKDGSEPICHLKPIFDLVDSIDHMCNLVSLDNWKHESEIFKKYLYAIRSYIYFIKLNMPTAISEMFDDKLKEDVVRAGLIDIISTFFKEFKANDLSLTVNLLKVLPQTVHMPCDYNAPFPSFKWLVCSSAKVYQELRLYIETCVDKNNTLSGIKFLTSNMNIRTYIQNIKQSQIQELAEKNVINIQLVATNIQNNIQDRFQSLGLYFRKIASYEKEKLNADILYIRDRINEYWKRFYAKVSDLQAKLKKLIEFYIGGAAGELAQAVLKMAMRVAKAGNPIKWLTSSGNADDILESANEIAAASRLLTESIRSSKNFHKLVDYSKNIAGKLMKNENIMTIVKKIIDNAIQIADTNGEGFEAVQSEFLREYKNYPPQVTKDELVKLESYWNLFIDEICDGISELENAGTSVAKTVEDTRLQCREVKISAAELVATQEEVYDLQFELMETMATVMSRLTQIQSSKIIGKGPKAPNPSNLSMDNIVMLMAASSLSYNILLSTNVQKLCNIMEYKHGRKPSMCNGLATDVDKLTALSDPICRTEFKYITVSTKKPDNKRDYSWLDLTKLYRGETVAFQIPNSKWWVDHARISSSHRHYSFYLSALELFMPTSSYRTRSVYIHVTPTNIDNKLTDNAKTNYVITPLKDLIHILHTSFEEGQSGRCRSWEKIPNPYFNCGQNTRPLFTALCPTGVKWESKNDDILLPSIYSKFNIRIEGYQDLYLSKPVTDVDLQMGIRFCSLRTDDTHRKKRHNTRKSLYEPFDRIRRQSGSSKCCSQEKHFYSEKTRSCEPCPVGSKSYFNSLFCGNVIDVRHNDNITTDFTYDKAVRLCTKFGSSISSLQLFQEAKNLGQKSCVCGWLDGEKVDSLTARSECSSKSSCTKTGTRYVHCKAVFTT